MMLIISLLLIHCIPSVKGIDDKFTYGDGSEDPDHWLGHCSTGKRQSPIDISLKNIVPTTFNNLVFTNYEKEGNVEIVNHGETVEIHGFRNWNSEQPTISGGGLKHRYKLLQLHFHWSDFNSNGSEHTLYGNHFPLEIHFLHVKENKTLQEAKLEQDGLMALAVFRVITFDNRYFVDLMPGLEKMRNAESGASIQYRMAPEKLLPLVKQMFYRYEGSLTTPGCDESVIWTLLSVPISISRDHLSVLREIRKGKYLGYPANVRPVKDLNGRKIQLQVRFGFSDNLQTANR